MANDTGSSRVTEKGPMTRSAREALSKKVVVSASTTPNRKSERLEKRTLPTHEVRAKSENQNKKMKTPSPFRRSERTKNPSPSTHSDPSSSKSNGSGSKNHNTMKLAVEGSNASEDEERDVEASSNTKTKRTDARVYRAGFVEKTKRDCNEESNRMDRSTKEGDDGGGGKIDECKGKCLDSGKDEKGIMAPKDAKGKEMRAEPKLSGPVKEPLENNVTVGSLLPSNATTHETSGAPERVQSDSCREDTSQVSGSKDSMSKENLIRKCVEHEKGENLISSKRKRTMVDMHSDASANLVDDGDCILIEDARPSRICSNIVGTGGSCSKRIRQISLSDVQRDQRKLTNDVNLPSSKSNGEKLSTGNKEGKSGGPVDSERPQGKPQRNNVESEKIRKQQRSLHVLLKPDIAKLCEILHLPDNVKRMVENCLEYTMNNYQICTEPASILQAFQLSLCWTAASLLKHKLDFEASLMLAKQHLNFNCKKEVVDEINSRLWDLKENFLSLAGNFNVTGSPKTSDSSNGVNTYTEVTPETELDNKDNSKNIKNIQKHKTKTQWDKLLLMQQEEKQKLENDIENETADFKRRCSIEWLSIQPCYPNNVARKEKRMIFHNEYVKRMGELKRLHEGRLKKLEAKQLEARQKFQESSAPDEWLNVAASKELGTRVESLRTHDQTQHHNASKALVFDHVAEGKSFDDVVVEGETSIGIGAEAPDTPLVIKHADANQMDIVVSKHGLVSGNKCNNITENEYDSQGNVISQHSNSREQCSDGTISMADKGEGCVNFSRESHNDCGQDATKSVLLISNEEICDGETSDVPSGEVALAVCKTSSSNNDHFEVPSYRQEELGGTMVSKPVCGLSIEVNANGLNSQSSEEHIPSVNTTLMPTCENATQIHEANDNNGLNNAEILNSPLSDKKISSNFKSRHEHVHNVNVINMPNCENSVQVRVNDSNGSNNVILNSPLIDERNVDATTELNKNVCVEMFETVNFTPSSTEQILGGAVDVSVLDSVLSRPCGAASPSNSSDANAIILLKQHSLERKNPEGVSSSIPAGQISVQVSENTEVATVNVLDGEEAVGMPSTVNCTDYPENVNLNSSSLGQISDGGTVLDGALSSGPCASSPSNGRPPTNTISLLNPPLLQQTPDKGLMPCPDEQIPDRVLVAENSHEEADCQLTDSVVVDKNMTSDQLGLVLENSHEEAQCQLRDSVVDKNMTSDQQGLVPGNSHEEAQCQLTDSVMVDKNTTSDQQGLVPGNSHEEAECQLADSSVMDKNTTSDQQGGVCGTMTENSLSQETPVTGPVDLMEPLEQVQPLPSVESPPDQDTARETQNTLVSSPVDIIPTNQSLHVSPVMEPPELEGQLPSAGFLSSNQDLSNLPLVTGTEDQSTNENDLPNNNSGTSIEIQNQASMQPALNMELHSLMPSVVRQESLDTRNLSTPAEFNNHPIQTATQSASRIVSPLCLDPLKIELERLRRLAEQNMKKYENMKLQLKCDFEKELEEICRKYDIKRQGSEVEFQKLRKNLDTQYNIVHANKILAEAFRAKSMDLRVSGASGMQQDASFAQQLFMLTRQQSTATNWPSLSATPSSSGPPAASFQSSYVTTSSQTMAPPILAPYNTPETFSNVSARPPHVNSISSPPGNLQAGGEIRAPAPHLQAYRPPTTIPASSLCTVPLGRATQPASNNIPVASPSFSHGHGRRRRPRPMPATSQSDPRRGHWPVSAGGIPTPNLSTVNLRADANSQPGINLAVPTPNLSAVDLLADATRQPGINLPNVLPHMPDLASLNLSNFVTVSSMPASSAPQTPSPDVVCLSDDDN